MKFTKRIPRELDRGFGSEPFFEKFFDLLDDGSRGRPTDSWSPAVEMLEDEGHLIVSFDLPGIEPKSIDLQLTGDRLLLNGERKFENQEDVTYLKREQRYGKFTRTLELPCRVDAKKVRARYENGVMRIELPKDEAFVGRQVPVEVTSS